MNLDRWVITVGTALALAITTASQAMPPGKGMGMGMDGCGPGMMGGGMGMGSGMMGMGPGMMMGGGMMQDLYGLDLNDDQRSKVMTIKDEVGKKHWELSRQLTTEHRKLHNLFAAETREPKAIGQQMQKVFELRRQMVESSIDAENRIQALLTPEQKAKLRDASQQGCMMTQ